MSNYIIDPSVFYWMNVLSVLQTVLAVIGWLLMIAGIGCGIAYVSKKVLLGPAPHDPGKNAHYYDRERYENRLREYEDETKNIWYLRRWMIATLIIGAIIVAASIFLPSKQTSIEMLVARTATFENVDWSVQQVKEIIDYIVTALKGAV